MPTNSTMRPVSFRRRTQDRINVTRIVNRLQSHIDGELELTSTQIQAARILLNKVVPDVKALEIKQVDNSNAQVIGNDQLRAIIDGSAKRIG